MSACKARGVFTQRHKCGKCVPCEGLGLHYPLRTVTRREKNATGCPVHLEKMGACVLCCAGSEDS